MIHCKQHYAFYLTMPRHHACVQRMSQCPIESSKPTQSFHLSPPHAYKCDHLTVHVLPEQTVSRLSADNPSLLRLASMPSLLCSLDARSIRLGSARLAGQLVHEPSAGLERPGEVTFCLLAEEVKFGGVGLEDALDGHETLDEERLGVVHVAVLCVSAVLTTKMSAGQDERDQSSDRVMTLVLLPI